MVTTPAVQTNPAPRLYEDIGELFVTNNVGEANRRLAAGWVLLAIHNLTVAADMQPSPSPENGNPQQVKKVPQDSARYVRRFLGFVLGRVRE